ncbi:hypothetical protein JCM10213_001569 [Rhodosporidiobolus nylandii]
MFRATLRRLASTAEISSTSSTCAGSAPAAELLPPLPLYRRLLRAHRKVLPRELRVMGDEYVKAEFRRTRTADNPLHIVGFLGEWKKYLDFHEAQLPSASASEAESPAEQAARETAAWQRVKLAAKVDEGLLEQLSADQIGQLYELYGATKDVFLSPEEAKAKLEAEGLVEEGIPAGETLPDLEMAAREMERRNREGR